MCVLAHGFVSLFAKNREVKLDEVNFAEPTGETILLKYFHVIVSRCNLHSCVVHGQ